MHPRPSIHPIPIHLSTHPNSNLKECIPASGYNTLFFVCLGWFIIQLSSCSSTEKLLSHPTFSTRLVGDSPAIEPFQVAVVLARSDHAPGDRHEEDVQADSGGVQDAVDGDLHSAGLVAAQPVDDEAESEDGKV